MKQNFDVMISKNNLAISENNVTLAPFLPTLSMGVKQVKYDYDYKTYDAQGNYVRSSADYNTVNTSATVNWTLFDGLSMFATRAKQMELLSQGEFQFRASVESLVQNISQQYYYIISLQNQVQLLEEVVAVSRERYNQALTRYKIGKDSGLESKQAKIYLNSDSSRLLLQQQSVKNAYIKLFELMNIPLDSKVVINDTIVPEPLMQQDALLGRAMEKNTSLMLAKSGKRISDLNIKLAKSSSYPSVGFSATYNYNLTQSTLYNSAYNLTTGPYFGFSLNVPIFYGFETNRKISNARIDLKNSELLYEQEKLALEVDIRQEYNTYVNNLQLIEFEIENKEAAYLNLDAAIEKYKIGSLSGIEFRDFQTSYLDASVRKINALYQAKISEITLHLLAGDLFRE
jgi:outer membrane protein TolC